MVGDGEVGTFRINQTNDPISLRSVFDVTPLVSWKRTRQKFKSGGAEIVSMEKFEPNSNGHVAIGEFGFSISFRGLQMCCVPSPTFDPRKFLARFFLLFVHRSIQLIWIIHIQLTAWLFLFVRQTVRGYASPKYQFISIEIVALKIQTPNRNCFRFRSLVNVRRKCKSWHEVETFLTSKQLEFLICFSAVDVLTFKFEPLERIVKSENDVVSRGWNCRTQYYIECKWLKWLGDCVRCGWPLMRLPKNVQRFHNQH